MSALSIGVLQGLVLVWPVLALAIAYRLFQFPDISVEGSFLVGAAAFAMMAKSQFHPAYACLGGVLAGAAVGLGTALLHSKFGINKFLSGILITSACYSVALRLMDGSNVGLLGYADIFEWAKPLSGAIPDSWIEGAATIFSAILVLSCCVLLYHGLRSRSGLKLRAAAIGGRFAENAGLKHTMGLAIGLAVTGALSGFGGVLISMRQGFVDISMNQGILVLALASLSLGEGLLPVKKLGMMSHVLMSALLGSVVYQIIVMLIIRTGLNSSDIKIITAGLVLVTICLRKDRFLTSTT